MQPQNAGSPDPGAAAAAGHHQGAHEAAAARVAIAPELDHDTGKKKQQRQYDPKTVSFMAFNFISAVLIVFVNKILFANQGFNYSTFTTVCHFVATWLGILCCELAGLFEAKKLRHRDVFPITLAFCGFVVFNNLSLQHNSIGFYQLMKVMTTPVIVVLERLIYDVRQHWKLTLSLVPVVIGVAMATVSDVEVNAEGTVWAVLGILSTSFYQLFVKSKQNSLGADSFQVLKYQAPQAAVVVAVLVPFLDQIGGDDGLVAFMSRTPGPEFEMTMLLLAVSSALAFCVNLSIFLVVCVCACVRGDWWGWDAGLTYLHETCPSKPQTEGKLRRWHTMCWATSSCSSFCQAALPFSTGTPTRCAWPGWPSRLRGLCGTRT